jgi:hypothetical protein
MIKKLLFDNVPAIFSLIISMIYAKGTKTVLIKLRNCNLLIPEGRFRLQKELLVKINNIF